MQQGIDIPAAGRRMLRGVRAFSDLVLPLRCPLCGKGRESSSGPPLCRECMSGLRRVSGPRCPTCGRRLPDPHLLEIDPRFRCGACRIDPPVLDSVQTLFLFQGTTRKAVHLFKYSGYWKLGRGLIRSRLTEFLPSLEDVELILPVPLHASRLRMRGFNQAVVLAREIAEGNGTHMDLECLIRRKGGRPQVGLHPKERRRNIRGCFAVTSGEGIEGRKVLLVDDVLTTGATAKECTRVLKKAGAKEVRFLALAGAFAE